MKVLLNILSPYYKNNFFVLLPILLLFHSTNTFSQESETTILDTSLAEKIYLQLDKDIYTTGSTIWFKSIVIKSFDNAPTDLSSVLHVELINAEKTIVEKKLIKLNQGIGDGYFDLPETLQTGTYLIRAYTEWNKNFDRDFFFEKYVQVFSIYDSITSKEKEDQTQIAAEENPEITSTINTDIDLQFLPESGELVHGLSSKVGFKALDSFGSGTEIEADIIDQNKMLITSFKSNSLGMSSFELKDVDSTKIYYARLIKESNKTDILYPLPKIASLGNLLSVSEKDKNITVSTSSNYLKNDSISLNVSFRGVTLYDVKAQLKNGNRKFMFSSNNLPEGIIVFKMTDNHNRAVAERIYFNKRLGNNLNIKITPDKSQYIKRDLTNISIEATNSKGEPIHSNASVLVINKEQLGGLQSKRDNISSYFLLSSELKGKIENQGYYFKDDINTSADLDALMLTQGWRQYKYAKTFTGLPFKPESSLTVSGHVTSQLSRSKRRPAEITMMTFGEHKEVFAQTTDSLGNFKFNLSDEYGKDMGIVLQSTKKSGTKVNYNFFLDKKQSPAITFNHKKAVEKLDSIAEIFLRKEDERKLVYNDFSLNSDDILLDEVIIEAYKLTPNRKKVMDRFGKPDRVIEGDDVAEKEKKWSFGLYSVLMFSFSDQLIIKRGPDGVLYAKGLNNEMTLVVVDGIPVREYEYPFIESIPPSEVSSVEVIEYAKNFTSLFCELFPQECSGANSPPQSGNIIAIYTYAQQGIYGVQSPKGIMKTTVPVFSQPKEFYAPKYNNALQGDDLQKPDLRSVIHWQPILKMDDLGKAKISFYNADISGEMLIVVEAIAENGAIVYHEYTYKVE